MFVKNLINIKFPLNIAEKIHILMLFNSYTMWYMLNSYHAFIHLETTHVIVLA